MRIVVLGIGGHIVGASAGGIAVNLGALQRAGETLAQAVQRAIALAALEWLMLATATAHSPPPLTPNTHHDLRSIATTRSAGTDP